MNRTAIASAWQAVESATLNTTDTGNGMNNQIKGRIVFLDYMRIFAFTSVLIGHKFNDQLTALATKSENYGALKYIAEIIYNLCYGGAAGVIVFFITSGYIITHVLQSESTLEFLIKRAFRIYPLYVAALILETLLIHFTGGIYETSWRVWIPRLLLIGDFFDTPHALSGVEWTLRIEVMFYLFMAAMKASGLLEKSTWVPLMLLTSTLGLYALPQIPGEHIWIHGYFTLYTPFLFIGSCIYLIQSKKANTLICIATITIIMCFFLKKLPVFHPAWGIYNFAMPSLIIFTLAWLLNNKLPDSKTVKLLSGMTYAVYLFHNWSFETIQSALEIYSFEFIPYKIQAVVALLLICYIAHKTIEDQAIRIGRHVTSRLKSRRVPAAEHSRVA